MNDERHTVAVYGSATVYFSFAFSLPIDISALKMAHLILASNLAETARIPDVDEIRVSSRYADLHRLRQDAIGIKQFDEIKTRSELLKWLRRHPASAIAGLRSLFVQKLRPSRENVEEESDEDLSDIMEETIRDIDESVFDRHVLISALAEVDKRMYSPIYLSKWPFVRMELRSFDFITGAPMPRMGQVPFVESAIVTLLVHASGSAVLTIAMPLPDHVTTDELVDVSNAEDFRFAEVTLAEEVVSPAAKFRNQNIRDIPGEWSPNRIEGTRWRETGTDGPDSVARVFEMYADAIKATIGAGDADPGWLCFQSYHLDRMLCCRSKDEWLSHHKMELAGLSARYFDYGSLKPEAVDNLIGKDWSLSSLKSDFYHLGNGVEILWDFQSGERKNIVDHFWSLALTDNYLLRVWQINRISNELDVNPSKSRALVNAQGHIISGLLELQKVTLTFGTARDLADHLVHEHGADKSYAMIMERMEILERLLEAERTKRAILRDALLTGLGSLAAVIFGLPAIQQSLSIAQEFAKWDSLAQRAQITSLSVQIYAALCAVLALALIVPFVWRRLSRGRKRFSNLRSTNLGILWPEGNMRVHLRTGREAKQAKDASDASVEEDAD